MGTFSLDFMPQRVLQIMRASEDAAEYATREMAKRHQDIAIDKGSEHRITGKGKKYPLNEVSSKLTGRGQVTQFTNEPRKRQLGFWSITTYGSAPHPIVAGNIGRRVKRLQGAVNSGRKLTRSQMRTMASLVTGVGLFDGVKPLRVAGVGPRFAVMHPGHGSLGTPWKDAEEEFDRIAEKAFDDATIEFMIRATMK